jgi:hypothetical protein
MSYVQYFNAPNFIVQNLSEIEAQISNLILKFPKDLHFSLFLLQYKNE